jgi:predicted phosphodiesterase
VRVAVLSDIHGFNLALVTVFSDLDAQEAFDAVVVAGDLCEVGPGPRETLDLLRVRDLIVLRGNTDRDVVDAARGGGSRGSVRWTVDQIGPAGIDYLAGLPFDHRITPSGGASPDDDLLVCHANPHNLDDRIEPGLSDRALREVLGETRAAAIAFGHYHVCFVRRLDQRLLVDVSAVGNPKDGDLRCKYAILTWDAPSRAWHAELRKLPYPLEATLAQIRASTLPNPERVIERLMRASY